MHVKFHKCSRRQFPNHNTKDKAEACAAGKVEKKFSCKSRLVLIVISKSGLCLRGAVAAQMAPIVGEAAYMACYLLMTLPPLLVTLLSRGGCFSSLIQQAAAIDWLAQSCSS